MPAVLHFALFATEVPRGLGIFTAPQTFAFLFRLFLGSGVVGVGGFALLFFGVAVVMPCRSVAELHEVQIGRPDGNLRDFALVAVCFKYAYLHLFAVGGVNQVVPRMRAVCLIDFGGVDIRHADFVFRAVFVDDVEGVAVVDFGNFAAIGMGSGGIAFLSVRTALVCSIFRLP